MIKKIFLFCLTLVVILFISCKQDSQTELAEKKSRKIISKYKAVFKNPPQHVPSFHIVDGPITGNGDIGLTVSGLPERQRFWISKNDFWKSGQDFKQCGPSLIGGIDICIADLKNASYHIEQILYEPVIISEFSMDDNIVNINARVFATANIIEIELRVNNKPVKVNLELWVKHGYESETDSGKEKNIFWVTRKFNSDNLMYPTEATIAMRCLESDGTPFILEPGKPVTIVASVITNHESETYNKDAKTKIAAINHKEVIRLIKEHNSWWQKFWAKSFVEVEDKVIEKYYYGSQYILACCSRNMKFPPGLYGNWITMDRLAWSGDYHLDYNYEASYWAVFSSNRVMLADPYDAPLLEHLPIFIKNARQYLNIKGAYASVAIGPKKLTLKFRDKQGLKEQYRKKLPDDDSFDDIAGQPMFLGMKSNAVFASMNMILRYHYTYDEAYIKKVYPYLLAVAEFWENYLKFKNNRYVIYDDSFGEVGPWQGKEWRKGYGDFNSILSLGLLRTFFKAMLEISSELNINTDKQEKWGHILAHLSNFPVYEENGRKRFRACEGGTGSSKNSIGLDWIMMHALVFPATNIGLSSDTEQLKMIIDDMKGWDDSVWLHHGNAFQTVFIGAARVGYNPDTLMVIARKKIEKSSYPNLWIFAEGGGIETCSGIPGMINEMMLQCHNGLIRIFPVFPDDQKASFYHLRTFGAFLVSSAIENSQVKYVFIESEKGRDCNLINPWPGHRVTLYRNGAKAEEIKGSSFSFHTTIGEVISLVPDNHKYESMDDILAEQ